ncbi:isocitrate lyase/PEP mutase family protein [Paenibacillus shenyangensis]|uniref:isocitrate lyase/PEP mutase family protein n=1 Tax=Paenibacillus sp. A9 TaxID=1284352 RepID=UPI00036A9771|nr:isocitrate lyase/phosphoenolpyruvate mutase family protein [Paenibacillus sp. A9]
MTTLQEQAAHFHALHIKGDPLVLVNVWDAGSTAAVQAAGARAIATGSWSVAAAHGMQDSEAMPLDDVVANIERIRRQTDLPLSVDIEGGYGIHPEEVGHTVRRILGAGAIGINIEDQIMGRNQLYPIEEQCLRIAAAREAADRYGMPLFINARTDIFLQMNEEISGAALNQAVTAVLTRADAYAQAGASGLFVPGLTDAGAISALCHQSELPVNIMLSRPVSSVQEWADLGVSRISYGPLPYQEVMSHLQRLARNLLGSV